MIGAPHEAAILLNALRNEAIRTGLDFDFPETARDAANTLVGICERVADKLKAEPAARPCERHPDGPNGAFDERFDCTCPRPAAPPAAGHGEAAEWTLSVDEHGWVVLQFGPNAGFSCAPEYPAHAPLLTLLGSRSQVVLEVRVKP